MGEVCCCWSTGGGGRDDVWYCVVLCMMHVGSILCMVDIM